MEERRQIRGRGMVAHGEWGLGHYGGMEKEIRGDSGMEGGTLRERRVVMGAVVPEGQGCLQYLA